MESFITICTLLLLSLYSRVTFVDGENSHNLQMQQRFQEGLKQGFQPNLQSSFKPYIRPRLTDARSEVVTQWLTNTVTELPHVTQEQGVPLQHPAGPGTGYLPPPFFETTAVEPSLSSIVTVYVTVTSDSCQSVAPIMVDTSTITTSYIDVDANTIAAAPCRCDLCSYVVEEDPCVCKVDYGCGSEDALLLIK